MDGREGGGGGGAWLILEVDGDTGEVCDLELSGGGGGGGGAAPFPFARERLGAGGTGGGASDFLPCCCCSGYSRTNFLINSISLSTTSCPTFLPTSDRRAVQAGSTPLDVKPSSAS
jgi:hypothetical protein